MLRLLVLLALLLPLLLPLCACSSQPLTGAWRSRIQFSTGDYAAIKDLEFLYVFNTGGATGGTMTESSNFDSAPPVPPAYGVWRPAGPGRPRQFDAFYIFYTTKPPEKPDQLPQGWTPAGRGELTEHITLSPDGKSFDSTITLQLFDPTGKPLPGGNQATGHANRIDF